MTANGLAPMPPHPGPRPSGYAYAGPVVGGVWTPRGYAANTRMFTWGLLACRCLGLKDVDYAISAAYIEYENVADPGDAVTTPAVDRGDDLSYYDGLAGSSTRDFLRIPLVVTPAIGVVPGDEAHFGAGEGNLLTVFVQTGGATGFFGRAFSAAAHSKVCGVALVAAPVLADRTRDVLFGRAYYAADAQQVKPDNGQVGIQYNVPFG